MSGILKITSPEQEQGTTLIQFALVIGLFMVFVAIAFDIFQIFNIQLSLQHAVTVGARKSAIALAPTETRNHVQIAIDEATAVARSLGVPGITFSGNKLLYSNLDGNWLHFEGRKTVRLTPLGKILLKLGGIFNSGYVVDYSIDVRVEDDKV